jgi:hypothetical protein
VRPTSAVPGCSTGRFAIAAVGASAPSDVSSLGPPIVGARCLLAITYAGEAIDDDDARLFDPPTDTAVTVPTGRTVTPCGG